ncbi:MAG: hypothetical protein KI791_02730 [Cyclobacteriaceae bacterium]|nr:hypothetical protein [Cyclobacteriaceae bacterium SS2]
MYSQFTPVDPDFYDIVNDYQHQVLVIHYFNADGALDTVRNEFVRLIQSGKDGDFALLKNGERVRLDRIITIHGRPGPAFDEYDSYANQCLDCMGGMD